MDLPVPQQPSVPVFDCHVLLSGPDETGRYTARAANLDGVTGAGGSQRQALLSVVTAFKAVVGDLYRNGEPIPWKEPPDTPAAGEVERWIPVHL
jgi:predicted RNase H-like HicB family nuclease